MQQPFRGGKEQKQGKAGAEDNHDCRCVCGSLVARVVPSGVELKCRRCKRTLIVPLALPAGARSTKHPIRTISERFGEAS